MPDGSMVVVYVACWVVVFVLLFLYILFKCAKHADDMCEAKQIVDDHVKVMQDVAKN